MMTSPFVAPDRDAPRLSHMVSSPIGRLLLLGDGHALTGLWMIDAERHTSRSGDGLTPSPETFREVEAQLHIHDETLTQALKQSLALVDVRVLDHFIVAGSGVLSFAERGLL